VLHHHDAVADLGGHPQVMGDEQHGKIEALAHVVEQLQHLRLHRHVKRRYRLVGDQHLGLHRQRAGDADALALAAGELVRKAIKRGWDRPTISINLRARLMASWAEMPKFIGPSMIDWPTVRRGFSELYGSWNTIWMSRR
jgi:hypothetical protein